MRERALLALSIQQPWAWLILRPDVTDAAERAALVARGEIKPVENRTWSTHLRGLLAIHAGQRFDSDGYDWVRRVFPQIPLPSPLAFERGGIVGRVRLVDCVTQHPSPWFFGPCGFVFTEAEPLPFRACRGQLGFFRPEVST